MEDDRRCAEAETWNETQYTSVLGGKEALYAHALLDILQRGPNMERFTILRTRDAKRGEQQRAGGSIGRSEVEWGRLAKHARTTASSATVATAIQVIPS